MKGWKFETVAIMIPSADRSGVPLGHVKHAKIVRDVMAYLTGRFGGATATKTKGAWLDGETGTTVFEEPTKVEAWAEPGGVDMTTLIDYCRMLRRDLNQGEIALIVGQTYYGVTERA